MSVWAVVVAAGSGARMGGEKSKTLLPVGGMPCIRHSVTTLRKACEGVVVVIRPEEQEMFSRALSGLDVVFTGGGASRRQSVERGLRCLPTDCEWVLIHDGARPFASGDLIQRLIEAAQLHGAAIPALPVTDTIKMTKDGLYISGTVDRSTLRSVQTPQAFHKDQLIRAYAAVSEEVTDDAAAMEAMGHRIMLVEGEKSNIKLTTPEDLIMAETMMFPNVPPRMGTGFDVHKLVEGRPLILCGITVPYEKGLLGHSDADVALHALTDALLGACALGDIGSHFPDNKEEYKGISSVVLLKRIKEDLAEKGFIPYNVDITIVAQKPKLAPYIPQMRRMVAETLDLPLDFVSVKATTTEHLGFEGRGEGISATAAAVVLQTKK